MTDTLTIKRVWRDVQGSPLAVEASIGATSIEVEEIVNFDENGGTLVIDSETVAYSAINEDTDIVTVAALTAAHSKGAFVQDGTRAKGAKYADGYKNDETSVTESVFIPSHLRRLFPLGGREAADMEVVPVALDDDGSLYVVDGPIDEELAVDPVVFTWSATGNISVGTKVHRFPVPFGGTIEEVKLVMGDGGAPAGSSIIVDILKGGTSILGTKVIVAAGDLGSDPIEPTTKEVNKGNILQIEFEQVGSTTPGSNPTLYVTMFPSENAVAHRIEVEGPAGPAGADGLISEVRDEGVAVTDAPVLDFTGGGVTVTSTGSIITANIPGGGSGTLPGLTDVDDTTAPTTGHVLRGNGTAWINSAIQDADVPSTIARDAEVTTAISNHEAAADPHAGYQKESEKGAASGYASLDAATKIPIAQVPTGTTSTTVSLGNHTHAQLHDRAHAITSTADHTVSGGTAGHVLRQTGATTFAWGAIQDADLPSTIARDSEVAAATSFAALVKVGL